jgi:hypothetical protein
MKLMHAKKFLFVFFILASCNKVKRSTSNVTEEKAALYPNSSDIPADLYCETRDNTAQSFTVSVVSWTRAAENCVTDSSTRRDFCERAPKREVMFSFAGAPDSGVAVETPFSVATTALNSDPTAITLFRSDYSLVIGQSIFIPFWLSTLPITSSEFGARLIVGNTTTYFVCDEIE